MPSERIRRPVQRFIRRRFHWLLCAPAIWEREPLSDIPIGGLAYRCPECGKVRHWIWPDQPDCWTEA